MLSLNKIKYLILFVFVISIFSRNLFSQNFKNDSLYIIYNSKSLSDSVRLNALIKYAGKLNGFYPDSGLYYGEIALKFSLRIKSKNFEARSLRSIGRSLMEKYEYSKAVEYITKGMKISETTQDYKGLAASYNLMGITYALQNNRLQEMEYRLKAIKYAELSKDANMLATCYLNIGGAYMQSDIKKSLEYKLKALKVYETSNDNDGIALCINQIGNTYLNMNDYKKALEYYKRAYSISLAINKINQLPADLGSIAVVYNRLGNYKIALHYLDSSNYINDKYLNNLDYKINMYNLMEASYSGLKQYDKAYLIKKESEALEDSLFGDEKKKELTEQTQKFENEKKVLEEEKKKIIEIEEKKRQTLITTTISIVLLITIVFSGFIFNRFKLTKKQKQIIEIKSLETEAQKHLVEEKQKEIIESITYAKRLQEAILPPQEFIDKYLPNNFILYKPKDLVAGDFYWAEKINGLFFIAAADSTGHGVPGAMVSVVCSNALNRTLKEFNLTTTGEILDKARELVLETFEKSTSEVKDGMDISLLCIDSKNKSIFWSGANNPLWYIQDNQLKEIKADKQPIGKTEYPKPFTTHKIEYIENTTFYLFTDGFADQFGGPNGKKFKYKQFSDLLFKNKDLLQLEQSNNIDKAFTEWKGDLEQVDDVCIIGIKI